MLSARLNPAFRSYPEESHKDTKEEKNTKKI